MKGAISNRQRAISNRQLAKGSWVVGSWQEDGWQGAKMVMKGGNDFKRGKIDIFGERMDAIINGSSTH